MNNAPLPLIRFNSLFPGAMGVPGSDEETGLRVHPTGTVFYVDPNFPGAEATRDGTNPTNPLSTVAAAIDRCQDHRGDVIIVGANSMWQYGKGGQGVADAEYTTVISEEVTLDKAGVKLIGVSPSTLGVTWNPASDGGTCITVTAIDCLIEGFVFAEGATYTACDGIYVEWNGTTMFGENCTIRNCTFAGDDGCATGIQLEFAWYCDIVNNKFIQCTSRGIWVDTAGSGSAFNVISGNFFQDCVVAAATLHDTVDSLVIGNYVYNGTAAGGGAATNEGIDTLGGTTNLIANNFFSVLNADWGTFCRGVAGDAWVANMLMDQMAVVTP